MSQVPPPGSFDPLHPNQQLAQSGRRGCGMGGCLLGCLGFFLLCIIMCGLGAYMFYRNIPSMARQMAQDVVNQSELADKDKQQVMKQIDRVVHGFEAGEVSVEQLGELFQKFAESPLFLLAIVYGADKKYLEPSNLSPEEKEAGKKTLGRVARGFIDKLISQEKLDELLDHISDQTGPEGHNRRFRDSVTDEELRTFLAECKQAADAAGVPDEPLEIDIGAEFKKLVDDVLGPENRDKAAPAEAPEIELPDPMP